MSTFDDSEEMQSLRTPASGQVLIRIPYGSLITSVLLALGAITISTTIGYAVHFKGMTATQRGLRKNKLYVVRNLTRAKILIIAQVECRM